MAGIIYYYATQGGIFMVMSELFSVNEAAAIAQVSPETIRTALEKKSLNPSLRQKKGKVAHPQFSAGDVLLMKVLVEFPFPLRKEDKEALAHILAGGRRSALHWSKRGADLIYRSGKAQVSFECGPLKQMVEKNLALYRWGKRRVVSSPDILSGEPVFRGTRIPLQHVAELYRKGVPEQEIVNDFPSLSRRDLEYAQLFARFSSKPGRPKKPLSFRRMPQSL
ncbi:MAG TPA: DUF433 domain-containing protein [Candidatus Angelobacter sp.]|nr:DUF433 domain-containing protein [Candidatus Angelobacter sp.]